VQPEHDESAADDLTVSPPSPLLLKLHAEINLFIFLLLHAGHSSGFCFPKTRYSKLLLHSLQ